MPSTSIRLKPGVDTLATPALNEAGISASNLIRFRGGLVEKRGGWTQLQAAIGFVPRALCPGVDIDGNTRTAVAGQNGAAVIQSGGVTDIAPRSITTQPAPALSTTSGSATVTVTDAGFTPAVGDMVSVFLPVWIGGLTLGGVYPVTAVLGNNQYQIAAPQAANATASGGLLATFTTTAGSYAVDYGFIGAGSSYAVGSTLFIGLPVTVGGLTLFGTYTVASIVDGNNITFLVRNPATASGVVTNNGGKMLLTYNLVEVSGGPPARHAGAERGLDARQLRDRPHRLYRWRRDLSLVQNERVPDLRAAGQRAFTLCRHLHG